ncbi:hypothetical protein O6H91_04G132600 [Diphasiastrum complanatum]|uniref:Uncharacterized protein n=1 Tax=Diphasiastrum complanatum TaxID=34168 RepID=A0ACC2E225_DIPCM|nr:hypothetical protein O6H91_04G132600 [Diphasiastrum complanatum]
MQDPKREIRDVLRGLVDKPSLRKQAEILRYYFTPDCKFYHFYINIGSGVEDLICIYQLAELASNYEDVDIYKVLYDEVENALAVHCVVYVRPWGYFLRKIAFDIFVLLELEDWPTEDGKVVKKIRVQRDYFERAPFIVAIPIIGDIYASQTLRFLIGLLQARLFMLMRLIFMIFLPKHIAQGLLGL